MKLLNKKGMTLFELLAVIVILGIVAAIAFPTVNRLIDNSKKDTFVSNANLYVNSAKTQVNDAVLAGDAPATPGTYLVTLNETTPGDIVLDSDFVDLSGYTATATITVANDVITGVTITITDGTYTITGFTVSGPIVRGNID